MKNPRSMKAPGGDSFVITVRAKPRARVSSLERDPAGAWIARLRSSPVDGRANAELVEVVAGRFDCPKSSVTIISGASSRLKLVRVAARWDGP